MARFIRKLALFSALLLALSWLLLLCPFSAADEPVSPFSSGAELRAAISGIPDQVCLLAEDEEDERSQFRGLGSLITAVLVGLLCCVRRANGFSAGQLLFYRYHDRFVRPSWRAVILHIHHTTAS